MVPTSDDTTSTTPPPTTTTNNNNKTVLGQKVREVVFQLLKADLELLLGGLGLHPSCK